MHSFGSINVPYTKVHIRSDSNPNNTSNSIGVREIEDLKNLKISKKPRNPKKKPIASIQVQNSLIVEKSTLLLIIR